MGNEALETPRVSRGQIKEIFSIIENLVEKFGNPAEKISGKKAEVVLKPGVDGLTNCGTVTMFSGRQMGEVKLLYQRQEKSGATEIIDIALREDGTMSESIRRNNPSEKILSYEVTHRATNMNILEFEGVKTLLSKTEKKLGQDSNETPCEGSASLPSHIHGLTLRHRIRASMGLQRIF